MKQQWFYYVATLDESVGKFVVVKSAEPRPSEYFQVVLPVASVGSVDLKGCSYSFYGEEYAWGDTAPATISDDVQAMFDFAIDAIEAFHKKAH